MILNARHYCMIIIGIIYDYYRLNLLRYKLVPSIVREFDSLLTGCFLICVVRPFLSIYLLSTCKIFVVHRKNGERIQGRSLKMGIVDIINIQILIYLSLRPIKLSIIMNVYATGLRLEFDKYLQEDLTTL